MANQIDADRRRFIDFNSNHGRIGTAAEYGVLCFCIFALFATQIDMYKRKAPCACTRIFKEQMQHKSENVTGSWETIHQRCGPGLWCLLVCFIHWWLNALEMLGQLTMKCKFGKQRAKRLPWKYSTESNRGICEWLGSSHCGHTD